MNTLTNLQPFDDSIELHFQTFLDYYNQETNKFYRKHKVYRYIPLPSGDGTTPADNDYVKDNIYQAVPKDGGS